MAPQLSAAGKAHIDKFLEDTVNARKYPAQFVGVTTGDGILHFAAGGDVNFGDASKGQVNENTTVELWSMTKLMTSIACLQLAEKGLVDFDDPALIEKHCPLLVKVPILEGYSDDGKPITKQRKNPITLRRLLTHTSGCGYAVVNPLLGRWEQENKILSWVRPGATVESIATPILFEPGTKFQYGVGIDWAGFVVMSVTGKSLEEYFKENIWGPCGMTSTSFYPTDDIKSRLMHMCGRDAEGNITLQDGFRPIPKLKPEDITFLSGGGGTLGTLKEYLTMLQHILACKDKEGGIISPASFKLLFTPSLPPRDETNTCAKNMGGMLAMMGDSDEPQFTSGDKLNHTLGLALFEADSSKGPKAGSGFWGGAAKTSYWIDPASGIAAVCGTNILDQDPSYRAVVNGFQRVIYEALEMSK